MSDLIVKGLVKRFGDNTVVDNISFEVNNGEFFVLLGPSGGGKSTTLRIISGLEQADQGSIILNGRDITTMTPRQRNLGMVFQDYGLYPTMTVFGNIAYGLETRNVAKSEIDKRVRDSAEKLGLTPHLDRSINVLSGGEQQRVALARILAKDADLFLFDEPLSNLDPKLRFQARRDILTVHRTKKRPTIYVTHDQSEAFAIADRIAVIAKGHLQQVGTSDELINEPANVFMARFIGSPPMNILPAQIAREGNSYIAQFDGISLPLPTKWNAALEGYRQPQILLGIPPTAVIPAWLFSTLEQQPYLLNAEVLDVEPMIGEIILALKLGADHTIQSLSAEPEHEAPQPGARLQIGINSEAISLFDATTEVAIKAE